MKFSMPLFKRVQEKKINLPPLKYGEVSVMALQVFFVTNLSPYMLDIVIAFKLKYKQLLLILLFIYLTIYLFSWISILDLSSLFVTANTDPSVRFFIIWATQWIKICVPPLCSVFSTWSTRGWDSEEALQISCHKLLTVEKHRSSMANSFMIFCSILVLF